MMCSILELEIYFDSFRIDCATLNLSKYINYEIITDI
jgi:hypothetical protein